MVTTSAINFLREQRRASENQAKLDQTIFRVAAGVFGVSTVLLLVLGVWWQYGARQLAQVKQQAAQQARIIAQSAESEKQYLSFVTRLDEIGKLLQERNSKKEALDFLSLLARPTLSFNNIRYDADQKELTFGVEADSVFSVEEFLEILRQETIQAYYNDISVSNIRRNETGAYAMELVATLKGEQGGN